MQSLFAIFGFNVVRHIIVGRLRLAVCGEGVVNTISIHVIVPKVDLAPKMAHGAHIHNPGIEFGRRALDQRIFKQIEEEEMGKVIGA